MDRAAWPGPSCVGEGRFHIWYWSLPLHAHWMIAPPLPTSDAFASRQLSLPTFSRHVPSTVDEQASLYRSVMADRRILVVLDNAATAARSGRWYPVAAAAWCWSPAAG